MTDANSAPDNLFNHDDSLMQICTQVCRSDHSDDSLRTSMPSANVILRCSCRSSEPTEWCVLTEEEEEA